MSETFQDPPLSVLQFRSGVLKEKTQLDAAGYWTDADKIRFRFGRPELMGGWQRAIDLSQASKIFGVPRYLTSVRNKLGQPAAFIATHQGLFSSELSTFYEITPIVSTVASSNILSTVAGSTKVVVSVSSHGLTNETLVGIVSAATTIGGNIVINPVVSVERLFEVSVISANSFEIDTGVVAAATSAATGGSTTVRFRYNAGFQSNTPQSGWGTGPWSGNFGWGSVAGSVTLPLRQWSADLWGTNIMAVPSGGPLMLWNNDTGVTERVTIVTAAPSVNQVVRVASEARHVVLYGTHDISGVYSPLLIRWCSQEDYTAWTPTATNTAGDYPLSSRGSEIRAVNRVGDKTAILTDTDLFIQSYIGGNDVFGFVAAGEQCGVISKNAAVEYSGVLYWMSHNGQFYKYDGRVQPLNCTVLRHVFNNLDPLQTDKIYAGTNSTFDEIIWFYSSKESLTTIYRFDKLDGQSNAVIVPFPPSSLQNIQAVVNGAIYPIRDIYENPFDFSGNSSFVTFNKMFPRGTTYEIRAPGANAENDSYVIYNVREDHWTVGKMDRTVWEDDNTFDYPLAMARDGRDLYYQESGYSADTEPLSANLEGAFFDQEGGNSILFVNKFVPDFSNLDDNTPYTGTLNVTLRSRKYPGGPVISKGPYTITNGTQKISPRLRGREISLQIQSSTNTNTPWRMGKLRAAIAPDGLR